MRSPTLPGFDITDPFGFSWSESNPYDHALAYSVNPAIRGRVNQPGEDAGKFWVGPSAGGIPSPASSPGLGPLQTAWSAPPSPMSTPGTLATLPTVMPGSAFPIPIPNAPAPQNMGLVHTPPRLNLVSPSSNSIVGLAAHDDGSNFDPDAAAERVRRAKMESRRSRSLEVTMADLEAAGLGDNAGGKRGSIFARRPSNAVSGTCFGSPRGKS